MTKLRTLVHALAPAAVTSIGPQGLGLPYPLTLPSIPLLVSDQGVPIGVSSSPAAMITIRGS